MGDDHEKEGNEDDDDDRHQDHEDDGAELEGSASMAPPYTIGMSSIDASDVAYVSIPILFDFSFERFQLFPAAVRIYTNHSIDGDLATLVRSNRSNIIAT